jgi:hypothetical protein
MGGTVSGQYGGRPTTEACRSLDVNRLHREGCPRPGWSATLHWSLDGHTVASIRNRNDVPPGADPADNMARVYGSPEAKVIGWLAVPTSIAELSGEVQRGL